MDTQDIIKRLRIGLALVVGFLAGKFLAQSMQHHASEFFIGGFGMGFLLTHVFFYGIDLMSGRRSE